MSSSRSACSCGVADWRALRKILGVSREQFAADLRCSVGTVQRIEGPPHGCPLQAFVEHLRDAVRRRPQYRERLRAATGSWPWPEDLRERAAEKRR